MKISIIGAGNVGGLTAMRLLETGFTDIVLVDITKGLAQGKALDLEDASAILKYNYKVEGTDDIKKITGSDIILITAGLVRKSGMRREDLLNKNALILKDISINIKRLAPESIVIVVTNPLDLMTYLVLKTTGFKAHKVLGVGITLDTARFINIISRELSITSADIEAMIIGSHGEGMLVLPRFTRIKGVALDEFLDKEKIEYIIQKTVQRGAEIISLLNSTSAYVAPSLAVTQIIKVIAKDQKCILGVCAYLNGEYGVKDICTGVPCRLGKEGIEQIIELDLNKPEKDAFIKSAIRLREQYNALSKK